ncbi:hypothetical protein ZWY2020_056981 [Hordeum vulgare]|nr:hypothetical protein ZWY2020_056981 [Hordeum vulgare]
MAVWTTLCPGSRGQLIYDVFDYLHEHAKSSTMCGFKGGPASVMKGNYVELTTDFVHPYKNQILRSRYRAKRVQPTIRDQYFCSDNLDWLSKFLSRAPSLLQKLKIMPATYIWMFKAGVFGTAPTLKFSTAVTEAATGSSHGRHRRATKTTCYSAEFHFPFILLSSNGSNC